MAKSEPGLDLQTNGLHSSDNSGRQTRTTAETARLRTSPAFRTAVKSVSALHSVGAVPNTATMMGGAPSGRHARRISRASSGRVVTLVHRRGRTALQRSLGIEALRVR